MRKSISTAFFSMVSTLMVLGIVLMGCSEWVLFKNYFAKDRYETLDQVVNVAKRTAEYLVNSETMPQGAELDALNTKLEIIGESELSVDSVAVGTHVSIKMIGDDEAEEYDIVGRTEADPINGKISDESPVGHALLGKAVGEKAEVLLPSGQTVEYEVLAITHAAN